MKTVSLLILALAALSPAQFDSGPKKFPVSSEGVLGEILDRLAPRQLGPTNMSGRIADIAVLESNPAVFYVASASGGLWKTESGGVTFSCVFDYGNTVSMGAVGLSQSNPNVVYAGTGEASSRNSVAWGDGVYKTTDGGKTWTHLGLQLTKHISKILVHPKNPDIVYVAAIGRLWGRNEERGIYKSVDGGKTWSFIFTKGSQAGVIDLDFDPRNPEVLYACTWDRYRQPYFFQSGGPDSGMHKSTDGGKTWKQLKNGLPTGDTGRYGLSVSRSNPNHLIATVEYRVPGAPARLSSNEEEEEQEREREEQEREREKEDGDAFELFAMQGQGQVNISGAQGATAKPTQTPPAKPAEQKPKPDPRFTGVPQDAQMNGGGLFESKDGGNSWSLVKQINPRPFYFSTPLIDPLDPKTYYVLGMNLHRSTTSGTTWTSVAPNTVHADHHAIWVNPKNSLHLIIGTDGGVYQSFDRGTTWHHFNHLPLGQFYAVSFDGQIPYTVTGGLQDNGSWALPTQHSRGNVGPWDAISLNGGDGFYSEADTVESEYIYCESQGGAVMRINRKTGQRRGIRPSIQGQTLRFNWNTPIHISPHDNKTIYVGSNRLMRSINRGDTWQPLSPDLTTMSPRKINTTGIALRVSVNAEDTGAERHCTIVTIDESKLEQGRIACGTDDGLVNITLDGGKTWNEVQGNIQGVPKGHWVSRVLWSQWKEDRLYVTFDGHRSDDYKPYVFVSDDLGKTWRSLAANLPDNDTVHVIREGSFNPNLLLLGTEMSLKFSINGGADWSRIRGNFPTVAVNDIRIHPKMKDAVIGTHGRAIWTIDIAALEGMTNGIPKEPTLLGSSPAIQMPFISGDPLDGEVFFRSPNSQPRGRIYYYLPSAITETNSISLTLQGEGMAELNLASGDSLSLKQGLNVYTWTPRIDGLMAKAGTYTVRLKIGDKVLTGTLEVLAPKSF